MTESNHWTARLAKSQLLRALVLLVLVGLGFIPLGMVEGVLNERQGRQEQVRQDLRQGWGDRQVLWGPVVLLPASKEVKEGKKSTWVHKTIEWLPSQFQLMGRMTPEMRHRGIYQVPVYTVSTLLKGQFSYDTSLQEELSGWQPHWDQAVVSLGLGDISGLMPGMKLNWAGQSLLIRPSSRSLSVSPEGLHARIPAMKAGQTVPFSWSLTIRGGDQLALLPAGNDSHLQLSGRWDNPSFNGAFLPSTRVVNAQGFQANWDVSSFARPFPTYNWVETQGVQSTGDQSPKGLSSMAFQEADALAGPHQRSLIQLSLLPGIDIYRETERALKYGGLFLLFHFLAVWLLELTVPLSLHLINYLLSGLAMVLFFLMLLSFAEHLGFGWAYFGAAFITMAMNAGYLASLAQVSMRRWVGGWVVLLQSGLYGYLYAVLQQADYSLLLGTIGLVVALVAAMVASRRIKLNA